MWTSRDQMLMKRIVLCMPLFTMKIKAYTGSDSHKFNLEEDSLSHFQQQCD